MNISASAVKELRERTGVGMMDCKKALSEVAGDMEKAIVWLREKGLSRAAKKAGRTTAEGIVAVAVDDAHTTGTLVEINCETDFAARNEKFSGFVAEVAKLALKKKITSVEALGETTMADGTTVRNALTEMIATVGENMDLRRVTTLTATNGLVVGYSHMGGRIGSLVVLEGSREDKARDLTRDLAMHVAAAAPRYLNSTNVPAAEVEQERDIARNKLREEGKPENMVDKIVEGNIRKFYQEVCFLDQPFVKDPKTNITQLVKQTTPSANVVQFARFQLGEGIEKKADDFAAEVAAQANR